MSGSRDFPFCRLDLNIYANSNLSTALLESTKDLFTRFGMTFTHIRANSSNSKNAKLLESFLRAVSSTLQYLEVGEILSDVEIPEIGLPSLRTELSSLE